ncbi:type II secretion system protein GspC [Aliidiomarina iranensis]|uniref:Type II secretion system protein GspC n=1 Tax=Aliidiomarina iranensis TaxID=1434071 RepID=A0A432W3B7_9GAMM|nr:type II secretion system protein GspC [Aliidiomarina iranensis]RUO23626.1 type II secretion system protein GspC [Aliidiomarina iranensis]
MRSTFPKGLSFNVSSGLIKNLLTLLGIVLLLVAAWYAAAITWRVLTPVDSGASVFKPQVTANQSNRSRVRPEQIGQLHLFGERGAVNTVAQNRSDVPRTTLNIRLVGATTAPDPARSAAIIEQGGNQNTYVIDETIASSRAVVREIYVDRIILENNGRLETLLLEGVDGADTGISLVTSAPSRPVEETAPERIEDVSYQNIGELINISPAQEGGELIGYRLAPKTNPEIFNQAGFRSGDIAVSLNGYDLTNAAEALVIMNEIQTLTSATVVVLRDGDLVELEFSIPNE